MATISKMEVTERFTPASIDFATAPCDDTCGHDRTRRKAPLPAALHDESTESDYDTLFRIAQDKNAPTGRLRGRAGIPAVKHAGE